ncbi:MAG: CBS domain-containing protein [Anaerolineae bacterium]|jgi:CBS domain-containing protein|nr:CBS domain-containing protein [Anaerolineae bacterium]
MQPHEIYSLRARDVMNRNFVLASPLETVSDAIAKMAACGDCQVTIVDRADEDDAYGIVTFQEIVYKVIAKSLSPTRTRVGEIMEKPLIVVNPTLRLPFVAQLFSRFHIQNAIVIEEHRLVGVVSSPDLVMALNK